MSSFIERKVATPIVNCKKNYVAQVSEQTDEKYQWCSSLSPAGQAYYKRIDGWLMCQEATCEHHQR
jgi:hypothetical protein